MTRTWLLLLGSLATVGFAVIVLVVLPRVVLMDVPVPDEIRYIQPPGEERRIDPQAIADGREVYLENGCYYCHSQQVRDPAFTTDIERGWGERPTVPADYSLDSPHALGTMRTGPDLINVGVRLPDPSWHLIHLYDPRALVEWSIMPAYPFLFEEREPGDVRPGEQPLNIPADRAPDGRVVVPTEKALALVAYLRSLQRNYPVPEAEDMQEQGLSGSGRSLHTMP